MCTLVLTLHLLGSHLILLLKLRLFSFSLPSILPLSSTWIRTSPVKSCTNKCSISQFQGLTDISSNIRGGCSCQCNNRYLAHNKNTILNKKSLWRNSIGPFPLLDQSRMEENETLIHVTERKLRVTLNYDKNSCVADTHKSFLMQEQCGWWSINISYKY